MMIEGLRYSRNNVLRHRGVDFTSQLDETRVLPILARLPGQIKRINGNAMPAAAGPGIEWHVAKWFRPGCSDHFPNINSHRAIDELEFVDQGYVHTAKNIFQQLRRFSRAT